MKKMILREYLPKISPLIKHNYDYSFTIFIPVYNAESTIERALRGIEKQIFRDFEVIIINDGSSDSSASIIKKYISNSNLNIRFFDCENNIHKMGILKQGIELAKGRFFLPHDADDTCTIDALSIMFKEYENIPADIKAKISGVTGHCASQQGVLIGRKFESYPLYSNTFETNYVLGNSGEKWGFTRTDILRQITINPEIFNRGLIPEGYLWLTITKEGYQTKYIDTILRTYYLDTPNSLSNTYDPIVNNFGLILFNILFINYFHKSWLLKKPQLFLRRFGSLLKASNYGNYNFSNYYLSIENQLFKVLLFLFWPFRKILKHL